MPSLLPHSRRFAGLLVGGTIVGTALTGAVLTTSNAFATSAAVIPAAATIVASGGSGAGAVLPLVTPLVASGSDAVGTFLTASTSHPATAAAPRATTGQSSTLSRVVTTTPSVPATPSEAPARAAQRALGRGTVVPTPFVGLVISSAGDAAAYRAAGLTTVVLQATWAGAQPSGAGTLDPAYLSQLRQSYAAYRAAGLSVTLDLGLQYAPNWVMGMPGAHFVDQWGDTFTAPIASGEGAADAVWNPAIQAAEAQYVQQLAAVFGADAFSAVRVGGLLTGELRYPTWQDSGHQDAIWDFSSTAQASSPVPGYRPGVSADDPLKDKLLVQHYLGGLVQYQDFLAQAVLGAFTGHAELMYPSWGLRPGDVDAALASGLAGTTARFSELTQGVDFASLVARIPTYGSARAVAYSTWIDAPDYGTSLSDISPVEYLATLATALGAAVSGENTASTGTDPTKLALVKQRVASLHMPGFMWFDSELGSSGSVTPQMIAR